MDWVGETLCDIFNGQALEAEMGWADAAALQEPDLPSQTC